MITSPCDSITRFNECFVIRKLRLHRRKLHVRTQSLKHLPPDNLLLLYASSTQGTKAICCWQWTHRKYNLYNEYITCRISILQALPEWKPPVNGGFHYQKSSDVDLWCFLCFQPELKLTLWRTCDVNIMKIHEQFWMLCHQQTPRWISKLRPIVPIAVCISLCLDTRSLFRRIWTEVNNSECIIYVAYIHKEIVANICGVEGRFHQQHSTMMTSSNGNFSA